MIFKIQVVWGIPGASASVRLVFVAKISWLRDVCVKFPKISKNNMLTSVCLACLSTMRLPLPSLTLLACHDHLMRFFPNCTFWWNMVELLQAPWPSTSSKGVDLAAISAISNGLRLLSGSSWQGAHLRVLAVSRALNPPVMWTAKAKTCQNPTSTPQQFREHPCSGHYMSSPNFTYHTAAKEHKEQCTAKPPCHANRVE